jgi:hypothetical protein
MTSRDKRKPRLVSVLRLINSKLALPPKDEVPPSDCFKRRDSIERNKKRTWRVNSQRPRVDNAYRVE